MRLVMSWKVKICPDCNIKFSYRTEDCRYKTRCDDCKKPHQLKLAREQRAHLRRSFPGDSENNQSNFAKFVEPLTVRSYKEVGEILVMHPEVVRQTERRALIKARRLLLGVKLEHFHDVTI